LSTYGFCKALPFDVSTVHGCQELARTVGAHEPHLDILVNNAGAAWGEAFDTFPESGWDKVVDLNMKSPFFLTQALHPALMASVAANGGRKAKVINIASIDGISINSWDTYSYTASKAGLIHLTKRMAMHLIEQGIVCNAIAPGPFASSMNKEARDHGDKVASRVPARRVGRDEDMAAAAIYLASDASDYVLGHTLVVDGGTSMARG
jgi:short-subunit dehydrogenase